MTAPDFSRISFDPSIMGGKPCIKGTRVTVGNIVGLIAAGSERREILDLYPYLTEEDLIAAFSYASWRTEEREVPLGMP